MKKICRKLVLALLIFFAKRRIPAQAKIIGVTGSVGKTTAKEAAAKILKTRFQILANEKSLNSEFGVPLTLLQEKSGFSDPLKWFGILWRAEWKSFSKIKADKIILELGVDKPSDLKKLLKIVQPTIGVFLNAKPVHLAHGQFNSVQEIAKEKSLLIESLPESGVAILNADDKFASAVKTQARKILFGLSEKAELRATQIRESSTGISAKITWKNESAEFHAPILGQQNLPSILAAIAVGIACGIGLSKSVAALSNFTLPPGRLNLLLGIHGSRIIDGSYNSNPASLAAALETLDKLEAKRKIVVLGQMNELGESSEKYHRELAKKAVAVADEVVGVFGDAKFFIKAAEAENKPAHFFETAALAGEWLQGELRAGDLLLVKGSQNNVRLEKCVELLLANREDKRLLCRVEA